MKTFLAILYLVFCDASSYSGFFLVFLLGAFLMAVGFLTAAWPLSVASACLSVIFLALTIKNFKKTWVKALKEVSLTGKK